MLGASFFQREPLICAAELVGCELVWGPAAGIIVETEAYNAVGDEACHTFFRKSTRDFVATQPPGTAYVYLNYGMHWLFNVLVKGTAQGFVLIRAIEPTRGVRSMQKRRGVTPLDLLCSGPGKLTQALGIQGSDHGKSLCDHPRYGFYPRPRPVTVASGTRIGISRAVAFPWRFVVKESRYLSRKQAVA